MPYTEIRHRLLSGRPLVLDSDVGASLRERGHELDAPGALGAVLHRCPDLVQEHHRAELSSRVDIISALTADTTPRALSEAAMEHRSARLTGDAVELAIACAQAHEKPVGVAGVLGSELLTATARARFEDETREHALRIATAGAELMLVRGMGSRLDIVFSVAMVAGLEVPCWAVLDRGIAPAGELSEMASRLEDAGAEALVVEVDSVDEGLSVLEELSGYRGSLVPGALLNARAGALRGFPEPLLPSWVDRAVELTDAGARIIGGGAGTTEAHTRALSQRLGALHPSFAPEAVAL